MANDTYQDYINSLTPQHFWMLDGDVLNTGNVTLSQAPPSTNVTFVPAICKTAIQCASFNGTSQSLDYGDSSLNGGGPWFTRSYSLWGTFNDPTVDSLMYNEGANVRNMSIYFGIGGVPAYIADNDADSNPGQPWSSAIFGQALEAGKPYHLGMTWHGNGVDDSYLRAYLNGVKIQEKAIFQNNTQNPGGQLQSHLGNIELGLNQTIIVSGQTFNVSLHNGLLQACAVWDGLDVGDAVMEQLYLRGAAEVTSTATFNNAPDGTEIRLYSLDINGDISTEFGLGIESTLGGTAAIDYQVETTTQARLIILNINFVVYDEIVSLERDGTSFPVDLLLTNDRNYSNP